MQVEISLIAKKYAIAFLNEFFDELSDQNLKNWIRLEKFLKDNRLFYVYLGIPTISCLLKKKSLSRVCSYFGLDRSVKKLMFLLLDQGRIEILDKVIRKIITYYRKRKNRRLFVITTSNEISQQEKEKITAFLKSISKLGVVTKFIIDESLISGLRIQSNTFLWERSIKKQLRDVKRSIFRQVGLW